MVEIQKPHPQSALLQREGAGEPWLEEAIIEREMALDTFLEQRGVVVDEKELLEQYRNKAQQVQLRKELLGVGDPEPPSVTTDKK